MRPMPKYLQDVNPTAPEIVRAYTCDECGGRLTMTPGGFYACSAALHGPLRHPETIRQVLVQGWPRRLRKNASRWLVRWVETLLPPPVDGEVKNGADEG